GEDDDRAVQGKPEFLTETAAIGFADDRRYHDAVIDDLASRREQPRSLLQRVPPKAVGDKQCSIETRFQEPLKTGFRVGKPNVSQGWNAGDSRGVSCRLKTW